MKAIYHSNFALPTTGRAVYRGLSGKAVMCDPGNPYVDFLEDKQQQYYQ
jgi:hypothetical protein